jgi:hypothetical protein
MADETAEEIAQHFSAMDDSVALIAAIVADDTAAIAADIDGAAGVKLMITRNTDHLEIQKEKAWYKASSTTKTPYTNAITTGKAYVAG